MAGAMALQTASVARRGGGIVVRRRPEIMAWGKICLALVLVLAAASVCVAGADDLSGIRKLLCDGCSYCPRCCDHCDSYGNCKSFKEGWYYNGKCKCNDNEGYYYDHSSKECVKQVHYPQCPQCCDYCDSYGNCKSFKEGWYYNDGKCECKGYEGYYYDHSSKECVKEVHHPQCPHCCHQCDDHGNCEHFKEGWYYTDEKCECKGYEGYHYDHSSEECVKEVHYPQCPHCCHQCDDHGNCEHFKEGWYYTDDKCECKGYEGYHYDHSSEECVKEVHYPQCPHCCHQCDDHGNCEYFKEGWYYTNDKCECKDYESYYYDHSSEECVKKVDDPQCPHCCHQCDDHGNCEYFKEGWYYTDDKCECKGYEGYYYDHSSDECVKEVHYPQCPHCCHKCGDHGNCESFKEGWYYTDDKCECKGYEGYDYDHSIKECVKQIHTPQCPHCCYHCDDYTSCKWFKEGWYYTNGKCECKQHEGFYYDHSSRKCVKDMNQQPQEKPQVDHKPPEEPQVDQKPPKKPRVDQKPPKKPRVDQKPPKKPRVDQKPLEEPQVDKKPPEEPRVDQKLPEEPQVDQQPQEKPQPVIRAHAIAEASCSGGICTTNTSTFTSAISGGTFSSSSSTTVLSGH